MSKINQVRKLLNVPSELRIGQYISNQMEAHDYNDIYYIPDDTLLKMLETKEDYSEIYRRIRNK